MSTLRFLHRYVRPHWRRYALGLLLVPISVASLLLIPYLAGEAVRLLETSSGAEALGRILPWIAVTALVRGVSLFWSRYLIISASRDVEFDLRNDLFSKLQALDQLFYKRARTGDLMARSTTDVERARVITGPVVLYAAQTSCMLALALPLMLSLSWVLTLLIMVPLSLLSVAVRLIGPRVHERVLRAQETLSDLSSNAQENFAGVRVVKSFAQEDHEISSFGAVARRYLDENLRSARLASWMQPVVGGVGDVSLLSLLLAGGMLILGGSLQFSELIKFTGYQYQLLWPMISIGWIINQYLRGRVSVDRLREILARRPRVEEPAAPETPPGGAISGAVSIRSLTFGYGAEPCLHDVSIEVPRGRTVAIVGRTGSGKSTLVSLIARLYPVPDGAIFVDGVDVNRLPLGLLRRAIGFVPQESFLFSRTVAENIGFGTDEPRLDDVHAAAALTRLDKDLDQFPRGYDELVGERGVTLSGGQKQRAALARALLGRPRILILDDALSAVDTATEEEIVANLKRFSRDLTTLVVSHRISSIRHADRIYVLDEGRVAEEGTHDDLLRRGGIYAEMHRLQLISDELARM